MSPRRFMSKKLILEAANLAGGSGITRPEIAAVLGLKNSQHLKTILLEMVAEKLLVEVWDKRPYPPRWVYFTPLYAPNVDILDFENEADNNGDVAHYHYKSSEDQYNLLYALAGYDVAVGVAS